MWFCCSCFNVEMHKPLVHDSLRTFCTDELLHQNPGSKTSKLIPNAPRPMPLAARHSFSEGSKSIAINFVTRPIHVQAKTIYKKHGIEIWPHDDEKQNSPKWTGWKEAWWMGFSLWLDIYHSWYLPWHQKQALCLTWKRASDPRLPTVGRRKNRKKGRAKFNRSWFWNMLARLFLTSLSILIFLIYF